jgi:hypothetical protein
MLPIVRVHDYPHSALARLPQALEAGLAVRVSQVQIAFWVSQETRAASR